MAFNNIEREPKIIERKSGGGWLGRILSLVIGIVLGIVLTVGGVFGVGYLILNKWSVNDTVGKVNNVAKTEIDISELLNKEYGDKTVLALLSDVTAAASELSSGEGTFATLNKISPKVGEAMGALAENLVKYGSNLSEEDIKFDLLNTPIKDFGTYVSDELINSIVLGEMLLSTGSFSYETLTQDPIMMVFFYGVEGEDYELDPKNQKILPLGDSKPLSIGDLRTNGITDSVSDIPLVALGFDDEGDAMMRVLLYGPATHYSVVDGEVEMNQIVYTYNGTAFFDIDGNEVAATAATTGAGYTLTFESGKTQYVEMGADGKYYAYKNETKAAPARYTPTTLGDLQNDAVSILDSVELASALGIDETSNPILISFAYGVEGKDFYYKNGKITMFEGKSAKTIGDLKGDAMNNVITDLTIDTMVQIDVNDAMLCALAYGSSNRYTVTGGNVQMNQIAYTFDGVHFYDDQNEPLTLLSTPEDLHLVGGGSAFKITFLNHRNETETQYVKTSNGIDFLAFADEANTIPALYPKNTVGDLQNDPDALLNTIELASVLNITADSNPILLTLAYGVEGEDFYKDGDEIKMYDGKRPKTIGDLKNGSMDETLNEIPLDALLTFDVKEDKMLAALAYGSSDRYTVSGGKAEMKQVEYTYEGGKFFDVDGNEVTASATATSAGYTLTFADETTQYVEQKTDGKYYAYTDATKAKPVLYPKNTIGDLQTDATAILNNIPLADVMNVTPDSSRIMLSIAYGKNYKIVGEGANKEIQMLNGAKPRTIGDLQNDSEGIFTSLYIADALNVTKDSHPVLLALAYGEEGVDYQIVDGKIVVLNPEKTATIDDLSGSKSDNLINELTLEAALGVNKDSDPLMKGLAFGQEDVHYTVAANGKIEMKQVWYTLDGSAVKDANGNKITYATEGETLVITVNGETQYLKADGADSEIYLAFDEDGNAIKYEKATLGSLSNNSSSLLNNITVADAMGIESYEAEEDALKKAIAFDSEGNPYTIGQLSNDPNKVIFGIHLDTVIEPDVSDPMIMYLLYGKKNIHYDVKDTISESEENRSRKITVGGETKYVVMRQEIVAVHFDALDGSTYHIHNEYGEALYESPDVLYHVTALTEGEYQYTYVRDGVTYFLKAYIVDDIQQEIRIVGPHANENLHLYAPAYLVFMENENGAIVPTYFEHHSLDSMAGEDASLITSLTTRLTLDELLVGIDLEENFILKHLSHTVISELPHSVETLTIAQVFEKDVYKTDVNGNFLDENGNITTDPSRRVLAGTWAYLLNDTTPDANGDFTSADGYTLLQMSEMMENLTANVTNASLFQLKNDGLITNLDKQTLESPINPYFLNMAISVKDENGVTTNKTLTELGYTQLGHFTVEHLLAFVTVLMTAPTP